MLHKGTPFDPYASRKFGITKTFRRSGKQRKANGNNFLKWYNSRHVQILEKREGVALVYTHLNSEWLNLKTRTMTRELEKALAFISSRNVWLAPASEILNRFAAIKRVLLFNERDCVTVINEGNEPVEGLTLRVPPGNILRDGDVVLTGNAKGKTVLRTLKSGEARLLRRSRIA
jgi:hypothetical protein